MRQPSSTESKAMIPCEPGCTPGIAYPNPFNPSDASRVGEAGYLLAWASLHAVELCNLRKESRLCLRVMHGALDDDVDRRSLLAVVRRVVVLGGVEPRSRQV